MIESKKTYKQWIICVSYPEFITKILYKHHIRCVCQTDVLCASRGHTLFISSNICTLWTTTPCENPAGGELASISCWLLTSFIVNRSGGFYQEPHYFQRSPAPHNKWTTLLKTLTKAVSLYKYVLLFVVLKLMKLELVSRISWDADFDQVSNYLERGLKKLNVWWVKALKDNE